MDIDGFLKNPPEPTRPVRPRSEVIVLPPYFTEQHPISEAVIDSNLGQIYPALTSIDTQLDKGRSWSTNLP